MAARVLRKLLVQRIAVEEDDIHARKAWTAQPLEQCNPLVPQEARSFGMLLRGWNRPHDAGAPSGLLSAELHQAVCAGSGESTQLLIVTLQPARRVHCSVESLVQLSRTIVLARSRSPLQIISPSVSVKPSVNRANASSLFGRSSSGK